MGSGERHVADLEASLQDIRTALGDVYEAAASVAFELAALVEIERARALKELGHDPLHSTNYDHDRAAFEKGLEESVSGRHHGEEPEAEPGFPGWINRGHDDS